MSSSHSAFQGAQPLKQNRQPGPGQYPMPIRVVAVATASLTEGESCQVPTAMLGCRVIDNFYHGGTINKIECLLNKEVELLLE